jgi:hypothetical protein
MPLGYPQMPWPQNFVAFTSNAQPPLAFPLAQSAWLANLALATSPTLATTTTHAHKCRLHPNKCLVFGLQIQ